MRHTKKGNQHYFGMKCHIGVDVGSGVIHTALCPHAKVPDAEMLPALLHGEKIIVLRRLLVLRSKILAKRCECSVLPQLPEGFNVLTPVKE